MKKFTLVVLMAILGCSNATSTMPHQSEAKVDRLELALRVLDSASADDVADTAVVYGPGVAFSKKNPGGIVRSGKFAKYDSHYSGHQALRKVIANKLKKYGHHTLARHCRVYSQDSTGKYAKSMAEKLGVSIDVTLLELNVDSLVKYHCMLENRKWFDLTYGGKIFSLTSIRQREIQPSYAR